MRVLKDMIDGSNFIAHIKVVSEEKLTEEDRKRSKLADNNFGETVRVIYQIKELFKGDSSTFLYEWGVNTSCDMGMRAGSEWIIFGTGKEKGISSVDFCGNCLRMRMPDGQQFFSYNNGLEEMKKMREMLHIPPKIKDGKESNYFSNGKKESETFYKNDQLDKEQVLYHSNGAVREINHFDYGIKEGIQNQFAESGQLLREALYIKDVCIYSKDWYDTSFAERRWYLLFSMNRLPNGRADLDTMLQRYKMGIQLRSEMRYDSTTKKSVIHKYKWNGQLEELITHDAKANTHLTYRYHADGKVSEEIFTKGFNDWTEEKSWDTEGKLIKDKTWQNGKYLGDKIKQQ